MAFRAIVCNVMIASPGDVQVERNMVREIVHEWNTVHAASRNAVLLPVSWETHSTPLQGDRPQEIINGQVLKDSDLLIAAFWTRLGTPTGKAASGTVEEIQEHIKAGKPALLYFSSTPVAPDSVDPEQYRALRDFRDECRQKGLYQTYDSTTDFRDKVRRHLAMTMNTHPFFQELLQDGDASASGTVAIQDSRVPSLSREAIEILIEAASSDGSILVIRTLGGSYVQANGKNLVEANNPRSLAIWEGAVQELVEQRLLESVGHRGEVFRVTREGYEAADLLKT
jgi:hypothetical protein